MHFVRKVFESIPPETKEIIIRTSFEAEIYTVLRKRFKCY